MEPLGPAERADGQEAGERGLAPWLHLACCIDPAQYRVKVIGQGFVQSLWDVPLNHPDIADDSATAHG